VHRAAHRQSGNIALCHTFPRNEGRARSSIGPVNGFRHLIGMESCRSARTTAGEVRSLADTLVAEAEALETEVKHFLATFQAA
jgi:hypothetical protein